MMQRNDSSTGLNSLRQGLSSSVKGEDTCGVVSKGETAPGDPESLPDALIAHVRSGGK